MGCPTAPLFAEAVSVIDHRADSYVTGEVAHEWLISRTTNVPEREPEGMRFSSGTGDEQSSQDSVPARQAGSTPQPGV